METKHLLPQGNYYKANLHCHTTSSDGRCTPEEIKAMYKDKGYSVVAYTDHNVYQHLEHLNDATFLAIAALEVDINDEEASSWPRTKVYHFNLFDLNPLGNEAFKQNLASPKVGYRDKEAINSYLKEMKDKGFLVSYNHPYWSLQEKEDYVCLEHLWAMEIYNYGCEIDGLYGYHPQVYDEMLRSGQRVCCVATDDNHNKYDKGHQLSDSFGGFTMIYAEAFTYRRVMQSLEAGHFYSSMGPEIYEMSLTGNKLKIRTSPVEKIYLITEGRDCYYQVAPGNQMITEATFELQGNEGYIRLDIRDHQGLHANTNAFFLEDLNKLI